MARKGEHERDNLRASSVRPGGSRRVDRLLGQCEECGGELHLYNDWKPISREFYGKKSMKCTCPNIDCGQEYEFIEPR